MAFILVRAIDGNVHKRGEILVAKDIRSFGTKERLPGLLRIEVTGATAAQIVAFIDQIPTYLGYTTLSENPSGWRVKMELDPVMAAATGIDKTFKVGLKNWILDDPHHGNWEAIFFDQSIDHLTCDIAKGQIYGLPEIKGDVNEYFLDKLSEFTLMQHYYLPDSFVTPATQQGLIDEPLVEDGNGNLPMDWVHATHTKNDLTANVIDRLAV